MVLDNTSRERDLLAIRRRKETLTELEQLVANLSPEEITFLREILSGEGSSPEVKVATKSHTEIKRRKPKSPKKPKGAIEKAIREAVDFLTNNISVHTVGKYLEDHKIQTHAKRPPAS